MSCETEVVFLSSWILVYYFLQQLQCQFREVDLCVLLNLQGHTVLRFQVFSAHNLTSKTSRFVKASSVSIVNYDINLGKESFVCTVKLLRSFPLRFEGFSTKTVHELNKLRSHIFPSLTTTAI